MTVTGVKVKGERREIERKARVKAVCRALRVQCHVTSAINTHARDGADDWARTAGQRAAQSVLNKCTVK